MRKIIDTSAEDFAGLYRLFGWIMSSIGLAILGLLLVVTLMATVPTPANAGWFDSSNGSASDAKVAERQEKTMRELNAKIGQPNITHGFEKRMVKMLYEKRDDPNYRTHTYVQTMSGYLLKICDSVGFGINASIQYSNPDKMLDDVDLGDGWGAMLMPQAEPNGLFMPEGLSATYAMCVDAENETLEPVYMEPNIVVSPFPLDHVNDQLRQLMQQPALPR